MNTVYLIKKPADFPFSEIIDKDDVLILIQDAVIRQPAVENWYACKEDTLARGVKIPETKLLDYTQILDLIDRSNKVVVW